MDLHNRSHHFREGKLPPDGFRFSPKKGNFMFEKMDIEAAASALNEDVMIDDSIDSPTSIPCGITISITLNC